ncbi:PaaI family thioesterase [Chelatococcus reniformis]|uniref:Thioesterase n=1 Tax=Chelatococcus reniformis TaxID=1494448 RepID=A0A916UBY5_9HYPH|nr:PaaI family thioesterase [Chelatococcus reniformis]GGC66761.1 thioesterase [Chelatococcus reniformis]
MADDKERRRARVVEEGEFAGWRTPDRDTFDSRSGPYYHRREADGSMRCAFRADRRHLNGLDMVHGGALLTFADHAIFMIASREIEGMPSVTVTLNSEFVGACSEGDLIEASGEVVRAGASMIFVRGLLKTGTQPVLSFSATIKRIRPKTPPNPGAGVD